RRLQTRLFAWFLGAILLAILASSATWFVTHPSEPPFAAGRIAVRAIGHNVSRLWDDPAACDAYINRVHETVGLDLRVRRDPENPGPMRTSKVTSLTFDGKGHAYIPIVRDHDVVGAVEFDSGGPPPRWWHLFAALGAAVLALAISARAVARR